MSLPDALTTRTPALSQPRSSAERRERIRVVFVIDNTRLGGTELNAVRTAEHLNRERFDLRVVCLGEEGPLAARYRAMGASVDNMPIRSFYGPSMVRHGIGFMRLLRREKTDIVHAHDVYSNIFASVWTPMAGVPVLITSRRWWHSLPNRKLQLGSRFAFSRSSAVLANSPRVAESVRSEAGIPERKVWTITNFVDDAAYGGASADERARLRRNWAVSDDVVVIGCVARFDPVKDHAGLLRAFARLRVIEPRVFLVLIGDGETRPVLERLVGELHLKGSVHFAGEVRGASNLHRGFDISVLASLSEGFPNTLVEAMAAGNPVVATAVGGSIDAVVPGETGLLVPPGRPEELAQAMLRLVQDPVLRIHLGDQGAQRAAEVYNAASVVPSLERMYERLLLGRGDA